MDLLLLAFFSFNTKKLKKNEFEASENVIHRYTNSLSLKSTNIVHSCWPNISVAHVSETTEIHLPTLPNNNIDLIIIRDIYPLLPNRPVL